MQTCYIQCFFHNAFVGLTEDQIGSPSRAGLNKGHNRANVRGKACLSGAVEVRMRGNIGEPRPHQIAYLRHFGVVQRGVVGDQHVVRVVLGNAQPHGRQFFFEHVVAQHPCGLAGEGLETVVRRRVPGGNDVPIFLGDVHAGQLVPIDLSGLGGIVGQESSGASRPVQRVQKIEGAGQ